MSTSLSTVIGSSPARPAIWPRSESPARLLLFAAAWFAGATAAGLLAALVVGLVVGVHNAVVPDVHHAWHVSTPVYVLLTMVVSDIGLLWAARRRGRVVGRGDAMAGLGGGPIARPRLLLALGVAHLVATCGWVMLLGGWLVPEQHPAIVHLVDDARSIGPGMQAATLLCIVGVAPLWEELFFRGWLWTGLQRHWRPLPVMLATALPWLLLHMTEGLLRPLFLLPGAVFFSLARHYCGGVRASLTLHVLNNLAAMVVLALVMPPGPV